MLTIQCTPLATVIALFLVKEQKFLLNQMSNSLDLVGPMISIMMFFTMTHPIPHFTVLWYTLTTLLLSVEFVWRPHSFWKMTKSAFVMGRSWVKQVNIIQTKIALFVTWKLLKKQKQSIMKYIGTNQSIRTLQWHQQQNLYFYLLARASVLQLVTVHEVDCLDISEGQVRTG